MILSKKYIKQIIRRIENTEFVENDICFVDIFMPWLYIFEKVILNFLALQKLNFFLVLFKTFQQISFF